MAELYELEINYHLRRIKTARDLESINRGVKEGYHPVIRRVIPSPEISDHFRLVRNRLTGEIIKQIDFRDEYRETGPYEEVLGWTSYYQYSFKSPFAAYLIPSDIVRGEKVFLEDLIEDYVGSVGAQGEAYRLESCTAIWTGIDLEIQYNPDQVNRDIVG